MSDFYYSLSVNNEDQSIQIGIDNYYYLRMYYPKNCNFVYKAKPEENGKYTLIFKEIFNGMDIVFYLDSKKIKEEIIIKEKKYCKNFSLDYKLENCFLFYDEKEKKNKILGKNQVELFSFDSLKVINDVHNKNTSFYNFVKLDIDVPNNKLNYKFNTVNVSDKDFPVVVDPTFNFTTKIKNSTGFVKSGLDRNNYLFVTGKNIADESFDTTIDVPTDGSIVGSISGDGGHYTPYSTGYIKKIFYSDDILYERTARLMFPYLTGDIVGVDIVFDQNGYTKKLERKPIQSSVVNGFRYDYVDVVMPLNLNGRTKIDATAIFDKNVYGNFNIVYSRTFTYLASPEMFFSNEEAIITDNKLGYFCCSILDSFRPKEFILIPYDLNFTKNIEDVSLGMKSSLYRHKDKIIEYKIDAKEVDNKSNGMARYYFDFPQNFTPSVKENKVYENENYILKKGNSQSFTNNCEVVCISGINNRSSCQELVDYKKIYKYISIDDFYFDIDPAEGAASNNKITLSSNEFKMLIYQKPTHFIKLKAGTFSSYPEAFKVEKIKTNSVRTKFKINNFDDFFIFEFGTFQNDVFYKASVDLTFDSEIISGRNVEFNNISKNGLFGYYLVIMTKNKNLYSHKIIENEVDSITIDGDIENNLKNSTYIGIFPYDVNEVKFLYSNNKYSDKFSMLSKKTIKDSGDMEFYPVKLEAKPSAETQISCNFRNNNTLYGGFSKKVSIRGVQDFVYLGVSRSSVNMNAFVDIKTNTTILEQNPLKFELMNGGIDFDNYIVPEIYKQKILYLNIDAPGFADKIILTILYENGLAVDYPVVVSAATVTDKLVFIKRGEGNRYLEIRIDQSQIKYSKITIKF